MTPDGRRWIGMFGNPVVWLGTLAGLAIVLVAAARRAVPFVARWPVLLQLAVAYAFNFLPFAFIKRPMYLYHYFFALIFSVMLVALGIGAMAGWDTDDDTSFWQFPTAWSGRLYVACIALPLFAFLYAAPMTYGWPLSESAMTHRLMLIERRLNP